MSASSRFDPQMSAVGVPAAWQEFLRSGEYARVRGAIRASGSEVPVDLIGRAEFVDERRLEIHLALAADAPSERVATARSIARPLTARERAVIALIAMGYETRDIAERLHISPTTVRTHVRNSMSKLGAHTRAQLVAVSMEGREPIPVAHSGDGAGEKSSG